MLFYGELKETMASSGDLELHVFREGDEYADENDIFGELTASDSHRLRGKAWVKLALE